MYSVPVFKCGPLTFLRVVRAQGTVNPGNGVSDPQLLFVQLVGNEPREPLLPQP